MLDSWPGTLVTFRGAGRCDIGLGVIDKSGVRFDADIRSPNFALQLVLRGSGTYEDSTGVRTAMNVGDMFLRLTDRRHRTILDPISGWREAFAQLPKPMEAHFADLGLIDVRNPVFHVGVDSAWFSAHVDLLHRVRAAPALEVPRLYVSLIDLWSGLLSRAHMLDRDSDLIEDVCRVLESAVDRPDLHRIASKHGISWERLRKIFARRLGCGPEAWRVRRRLERAAALLRESDDTIQAIAERLGFSSAFELSRQFRHRYGLPPSHFRSQLCGDNPNMREPL